MSSQGLLKRLTATPHAMFLRWRDFGASEFVTGQINANFGAEARKPTDVPDKHEDCTAGMHWIVKIEYYSTMKVSFPGHLQAL
ncbi:MAG: hypothetical protein ABIU20_00735 [Blastocatellia bacterium]